MLTGISGIDQFTQSLRQLLTDEALPDLPGVPMVTEASEIFGDRLFRLVLLGRMCTEANDAIIEAGFDPVDFHIDPRSVDRFMATDHLRDENAMFNGVFFDWLTEQGTLIRAAMTLVFEGDELAPSIVDILRIGPEDDHWEILDEGEWDDDGPPAELFDFLEEAWAEDSGEEDEWTEDHSLAQLDISVETYNALDQAGIESLDELAELKAQTVQALVGEDALEEVRLALQQYGLQMRDE